MGSIQKKPVIPKLPTVKLDTTLIDLYKLASPRHAHARLGMVFGLVNSGIDLTPDIPRNTKFLYQDSPFINVPRDKLTRHNHQLQKALSIRYLSLVPQRDAFISGQTPTVLFYRGQTAAEHKHDQSQAEETFSVLDSSQQPEVIFCPGPSQLHMALKQHDIQHMTYKIVSDEMPAQYEDFLLHDPEVHWYMNSKAALATSGLPTPKTTIFRIDGFPPSPSDCCSACQTSANECLESARIPHIPKDCTGPRRSWLNTQKSKLLDAIKSQALPFVLKTQQTFGGAGTWVITTPEQKSSLLSDFTGDNSLLEKLLPQVTEQNSHLQPAAMLISEFVDKPANNYGITFAVTAEGKAIFLAASEQIIDHSSGAWLGSTIDYAHQDKLRSKFQWLIDDTAEWICKVCNKSGKSGYFGPVGIDVLETELPSPSRSHSEAHMNENGHANGNGEAKASKFDIVDLNVRPSGSLALPLLKTHFTSRGLNLATSSAIRFRGGRVDFLQRWRKEFEHGSMVILSWYEDHHYGDHEVAEDDGLDGGTGNTNGHSNGAANGEGKNPRKEIWSVGDVVVGAQDRPALMELLERVRECSEEVTF